MHHQQVRYTDGGRVGLRARVDLFQDHGLEVQVSIGLLQLGDGGDAIDLFRLHVHELLLRREDQLDQIRNLDVG